MPAVLITGSSGFVGSQTYRKLELLGWPVTGTARRSMPDQKYIQADLADPFPASLDQAIAESDVVIHAAARSSPWGTRRAFHRANVTATQRLLAACRKSGRPRIVFLSSSAIFCRNEDQFGINESTPPASRPVNAYAATKLLAEQEVRNYDGSWVIVRPRAVYGVGDRVVFPRILAAAKAGTLPILKRDGPPVVGDLISIGNLTDRLVQLSRRRSLTGIYNLTDNDPQPILPFLFDVFERLGIERPTREVDVNTAYWVAALIETFYRVVMPWREPPITRFGVQAFAYSRTFDVEKMLRDLGPPQQSTEQAVNEFIAWVRQQDPYSLNLD